MIKLSEQLARWLPIRDVSPLSGAALGSFVVRVSDAGLYFALSILLARSLGPDGYGLYSLAYAVTMLLALPVQSGLPTLLVREVARYELDESWGRLKGILRRSNQLVAVLATVIVGGGVIALLALGDRLSTEQRLTYSWALVLLPLVALGNLWGAGLRGLRRVIQGQLPESVIRPGVFVALLLVAIAGGAGVSASDAMALHSVAALIAFLFGVWLLRRELPPSVGRQQPRYETRAWLEGLLPLTLLAGIHLINARTDILLLGLLASSEDVGVYKVAFSASSAVTFALGAVAMVAAPYLSRAYASEDTVELQRLVSWTARGGVLLAAPAALILVGLGRPLLEFVFGSAFAAGHVALAILALGQLVNVAAGAVALILNMTGYERDTVLGIGIAAVANIGLNITLIPIYGINGAAMATTVSLVIWNSILIQRVWRRLGVVSVAWYPRGIIGNGHD